jgi:RND family efflux transporter MFP subunit
MKIKLIFVLCLISYTFLTTTLLAEDIDIDAFTSPSSDVLLSFVIPGKVADVRIKIGDVVKKGTLLITQDDSLEKAKLKQLVAGYDNSVKEKAELSKLEQRKRDLAALRKATRTGATSRKEMELAALEVKQLEYALEMLAFEKSQILKKINEEKIALSQMRLYSPLSGVVESIAIEKGESVQQLKEIVRIIRVNPLWIDVNIPLNLTENFNVNDKCFVTFPSNSEEQVIKEATVIFKSFVADPGSDTLKYRLEVSNPEKRIAGERVSVTLPKKK